MGQAQLLLIVLGVVLVGIAIIAGIQAYDQNNRKASLDALTHDAIRMASDLQTWVQKPPQFGGPEIYGDFTSKNPTTGLGAPVAFGYRTDDTIGDLTGHQNSNGICAMETGETTTITCQNPSLGTLVEIEVEDRKSGV